MNAGTWIGYGYNHRTYIIDSYTPRTLHAHCSQSDVIIKISKSSACALFLYNCTHACMSVAKDIDSFATRVVVSC